MTTPTGIWIELLSATAFSTGEVVPGVADSDVEHDDLGLPIVLGKRVANLLRDAWCEMADALPDGSGAVATLLGVEASLPEATARDDGAIMRPGTGRLADHETDRDGSGLTAIVAQCLNSDARLTPVVVIDLLTSVRTQTAEDRTRGAPADHTLRSIRTINRAVMFRVPLRWTREPEPGELSWLARLTLGVRASGLRRNRGLGRIRLALDLEGQTFADDRECTIKLASLETLGMGPA